MLVHMTPNEVNSLQGLAMVHGGSLTINPHTGLPEAGWLGKLLPTILGGVGMAFGIPPVWMGLLGLVGGTAITGSLKEGIMAGLGAYGGASLAGAAGLGGALGHVGSGIGLSGSGAAVMHPVAAAAGNVTTAGATAIPTAAATNAGNVMNVAGGTLTNAGATTAANVANAGSGLASAVQPVTSATLTAAKTGLAGAAQNFGQAARAGLPGGIIGSAAPKLAAYGALQGIGGAMTPSGGGVIAADGRVDNSYQGPYYAQKRTATFAPTTEELLKSSKQRKYFDVDTPEIYNTMGQVVQPGSQTVRGTQIMQPVLRQTSKNAKYDKGKPMYDFVPVTYQGGIDPNQNPMSNFTGYAHAVRFSYLTEPLC
jgi:hypothetical protein